MSLQPMNPIQSIAWMSHELLKAFGTPVILAQDGKPMPCAPLLFKHQNGYWCAVVALNTCVSDDPTTAMHVLLSTLVDAYAHHRPLPAKGRTCLLCDKPTSGALVCQETCIDEFMGILPKTTAQSVATRLRAVALKG